MNELQKVRLDKWLWAARFFKTRAKAKQAIDGGKIHIDGVRGKAGKELRLGDQLKIRQGWDEKTVVVMGLSEKRGGAPDAERLYRETPESTELRLRITEQRRSAGNIHVARRPSKKDRRLIHRFHERNLD
ncbi:MAG: S4 domain-containing protein [bacterium]|nr:RNA-binding protein [Gammaproteobacteria bacterium]HIL98932.1 RNA-binding protein [Pseudomonadales bacterium]